jgi:wyosine [tRNA(Phe)-imidazoG37] synthetase (radical SAM superfamily)
MNEQNPLVFGPVPSRRLGKSIGINNIPPKRCTYSCVYCQLGKTHHMQINRETFYDPDGIIRQTKEKIIHAKEKNEHIDYLTIVPDGEPTLDENVGVLIKKLKNLNYPVAVITNSSLISQEDVRTDLELADLVSVKIDTIDNETWKQIDRPHGKLVLSEILEGLKLFSKKYNGSFCTESMLVRNLNDGEQNLSDLAKFISTLKPKISYLSIPTRPPAESWVKPATEKTLTQAYELFIDQEISTEYLIGYEGNEFAFTGNAKQDILSITAVHPMRQDAIEEFLHKANENWTLIERLIKEKKIVKQTLNNTTFYLRKLPER